MLHSIPSTTWILLALAVLFIVVYLWLKPNQNQSKIGMANRRLGASAKFSKSLNAHRLKDAQTNLHPAAPEIGPGLPLGRIEAGTIYQGWRQCAVQVQGPGRGKTSAQVIPHAVAAPGALVVTSNKSDGIWEIIAERMFEGNVIIFDPTNILNRKNNVTSLFNVIGMVRSSTDAEKIGAIFEAATHGEGPSEANVNAHFDVMGSKVIGALMLAANLSGKGDDAVFGWAMRSEEDEPAAILTEYGFGKQAETFLGLKRQPSDTRGSVWATAQRCVSPFEHDEYLRTLTTESGDDVFDPTSFANSTDTLILLGSKKGGSSSALVSALVWDVFRSAERAARTTDNGRLQVPLVIELDEVGNAVNLPELPEWYSYAGSLGIVFSAYFQSVSQGKRVYGENGMNELFGAASVFVYGGGGSEESFLSSMAKLVGSYDHQFTTHSSSYNHRSGQGRSSSTQIQQRDILSASDLAKLPQGKMFVRTGDGEVGVVDAGYWFKNELLVSRIEPQMKKLKESLKAH